MPKQRTFSAAFKVRVAKEVLRVDRTVQQAPKDHRARDETAKGPLWSGASK